MTIQARTPLLVRGFTNADGGQVLPSRPDGAGARQLIIPGSALAGAVRSLHEALAVGCLRVFHDELVPVYRHSALPSETRDVRLATVSAVDHEHRPTSVQLCETGDPQRHRLDTRQLRQLDPDGVSSGTRLRIIQDDRQRITGATMDPAGDWVVFISDIATPPRRKNYRAAVRRLTNEYRTVPSSTWMDFLDAVDGADDLRPNKKFGVGEEWFLPVQAEHSSEDGTTETVVVGRRCRVRREFRVGQPVWVRENGTEITELRMALLWRRHGSGAGGDRIPRGFAACHDPADLCPTCRLFGSADTRTEDNGQADAEAVQRSYRGHVRFGDATPSNAVHPLTVTLPPMAAPRPGAGQFYLDTNDTIVGNGAEPPLREWGSTADARRLRRLRGRKFYWHTSVTPGAQLPRRGRARPHHEGNNLTSKAEVFPIGTTLTATVIFTDLDTAQLGGLLAALDPRRLLGETVVHHVGGGRPLGYGSCTVTVEEQRSQLWRSGARYGTAVAQAAVPDFREAVDQLRADMPEPVRRTTWAQLTKALTLDAVAADEVWYPPGADWDQRGQKKFDEGYAFWQQTSGLELKSAGTRRKGRPLQPLPNLDEDDQALPIVTRTSSEDLRGRQPR